ncbi:hypothetical protein MJH12_14520, partial [bacterium]|nr:hypothetical protein [bacterium]
VVTIETTTVLEYPADLVVDFKAQSLDVLNGPASTITLDMDGALGNLISARGTLNLNLFNFFQVSGDFAFEKYESEITLSDGNTKSIDLLTLGGKGVNAFAGLDANDPEALGLQLTGVDFALALMSDKEDTSLKWTSLQATADGATFLGLGDDLSLSGTDLFVEINKAAKDETRVDFLVNNFAVKNSQTTQIDFNMDGSLGELLSVGGNIELNVSNFFTINGGFAFTKSTEAIILSNGTELVVDALTLGANKVSAFIGLDGDKESKTGFEVQDMSFALAILKEADGAKRKWVSVLGDVKSAEFVGIDDVTIKGQDLKLQINKKASDNTVVDFSAKNLEIRTSLNTKETLDIAGSKGEYIGIAGNLTLNLFDFFTVSGGFAFTKHTETVKLSDGSTQVVDLMTLGANNVNAFVGLNAGTADAIGFSLAGLNFGLSLMSYKDSARKWTSLYATADSANFLGLPDALNINPTNISVEINMKDKVDGFVVDYSNDVLVVETSAN